MLYFIHVTLTPRAWDNGSKSTFKHTEKTDKSNPRTEKVSLGGVFYYSGCRSKEKSYRNIFHKLLVSKMLFKPNCQVTKLSSYQILGFQIVSYQIDCYQIVRLPNY